MVQRIVADLEKENIIPIIKDQTESARLAGFGGGIVTGSQDVYVHKDEHNKANLVLDTLKAELQN